MTTELVPTDETPPRPPAVPPPMLDLVEAWQGDKKPSTREGYAKDLRDFARFVSGDPAVNVGAAVERFLTLDAGGANGKVLEYRNHQLAAGLASATIARRLSAVKSIVKLARTLGRVSWSIEIQAPAGEPRRDMRGPNPDEVRRLLKVLRVGASTPRGKRDRAAVFLMFGLAMRRAEVVGLDLADVDFPTATLWVTRKGKREREQLAVPEPTVLALESWLAARGVEPGALFTGLGPNEPGGRLTGNGIWRAVSRLGKEAKLARGLWPHAFRHAAATVAAERTEKDFEVMAFTGHAKPQTAGRYLDTKREAQARVARLVAKDLKL